MPIFSDVYIARDSYSHFGRVLTTIRNFCYSCKSLAVVHMETKQRNRKTSRGSKRMEPEIHETSGRQDIGSGNNHQSDGKYEGNIEQKEIEYLKQKDRIKYLKTDLENFICENFDDGKVFSLPKLFEITFNVYEGWYFKLVYADKHRDIYHVDVEKEASIPWHQHTSDQYIQVLYGNLTTLVEESDGSIKKYNLQAGDSLVIKRGKKHLSSSLEKTKMVVTYEPPLSTDV